MTSLISIKSDQSASRTYNHRGSAEPRQLIRVLRCVASWLEPSSNLRWTLNLVQLNRDLIDVGETRPMCAGDTITQHYSQPWHGPGVCLGILARFSVTRTHTFRNGQIYILISLNLNLRLSSSITFLIIHCPLTIAGLHTSPYCLEYWSNFIQLRHWTVSESCARSAKCLINQEYDQYQNDHWHKAVSK